MFPARVREAAFSWAGSLESLLGEAGDRANGTITDEWKGKYYGSVKYKSVSGCDETFMKEVPGIFSKITETATRLDIPLFGDGIRNAALRPRVNMVNHCAWDLLPAGLRI